MHIIGNDSLTQEIKRLLDNYDTDLTICVNQDLNTAIEFDNNKFICVITNHFSACIFTNINQIPLKEFIKTNNFYTDINTSIKPVNVIVASFIIAIMHNNPKEQLFTWSDDLIIDYDKLNKSNWAILDESVICTEIRNILTDLNVNYTKDTNNVNGIFGVENKRENDTFCYNNNLAYFDCGVAGTKGSIQPVIPFITDTYSNSYDPNEKSYPICIIKNFPNNQDHLIQWAIENFPNREDGLTLFNKLFNEEIDKLLSEFPDNEFWLNGKLKPIPIEYDNNNKLHEEFIKLTNKINTTFDNNNDLHLEWTITAAIIRSINYNIPFKKPTHECKTLTSSSLVAGLAVIEMLKYISNNNNYKISFFNLESITFITCEPKSPQIIKVANQEFNCWTKFNQNEDILLLDFLDKYQELFKTTISIITQGSKIIYADFMNNENKLLSKIINNNSVLTLLSDDDNLELPNILFLI